MNGALRLVVLLAVVAVAVTLALLVFESPASPGGPIDAPRGDATAPSDPTPRPNAEAPPSPTDVPSSTRVVTADRAGLEVRYAGFDPARHGTFTLARAAADGPLDTSDPRAVARAAEQRRRAATDTTRRHESDADAVARVRGLTPGHWRFRLIEPPGFEDVFDVEIPATSTEPIVVERPWPARSAPVVRLAGSVRDARDGSPIAAASVAVFSPLVANPRQLDAVEPIDATATDALGAYFVEHVAAGGDVWRYVVASADGYLPAVHTLEDTRIGAGGLVREFDFTLTPSGDGARIVGVVAGATEGGPAAGATVRVFDPEQRWANWRESHPIEPEATASGADGSFAVDDVAPGHRLVSITADGHRAWTKWLALEAATTTDLGTVELTPTAADTPPLATFAGSLEAPDGSGIEGAQVAVRDRQWREHATRTDADGRWSLDVPSGRATATIRASGWPEVVVRIELRPGELTVFHHRHVDGSRSLGGTVRALDDGRTLPGIAVEVRPRLATGTPGGVRLVKRATTDEDGRFEVAGLPGTSADVALEWNEPFADLFVEDLALDRDDHVFRFPFPEAVTVRGVVGDGTGQPIADATLAVAGGSSRATSAADGSFSLAVPMSRQTATRIAVTKSGYASVTGWFVRDRLELDAGRSVTWNPQLHTDAELATVHGRVTDAGSGLAVAGVDVGVYSMPAAGEGGFARARTDVESDAEGEFRAAGVRPGRVEMSLRHRDYAETRLEIDVPPGSEPRHDVVLSPVTNATFAFALVDEAGQPLAGIAWSAWSRHPRKDAFGTTAADGRIELVEWPSATGRLNLVFDDDRPNQAVTLSPTVLRAEPVRLTVRRGDEVLRGIARNADGSAAARVPINIVGTDGDPRIEHEVTTDDAGHFAFERLPSAASFRVSIGGFDETAVATTSGATDVELTRR